MSTLHISLFGKFCVKRGGRVLEGFDARKVQELFCYLLLHREHSLSREVLASVLWPETTTALSKKNLRQALWQLQSALGSQGTVNSGRVVVVDPEWIQLNAQADLWLDVAALEHASNVTQNVPGEELDSQQALMLQQAVQLYQGPLLEGWYNDWCMLERERLQTLYLAMLDRLMEYCEARRDYETGLLYGTRILYTDRARERTHRRLMRLHYLNGDRAAALRQFEQCAITLEEELGAKPSRGTVALYEQVLAEQLVVPEQAPAPSEIPHEVAKLLQPGVLDRLLQLQATLADLQNQVGQSIQVVEEALASYAHAPQVKPTD